MTYKAFTNQGFCFQETIRVAKLLNSGVSVAEIAQLVLEQNLFELRSVASRKTLANAVLARFEDIAIPDLSNVSLEAQRLMVLLLIARQHRLLSELMLELSDQMRVAPEINQAVLQRFLSDARERDVTLLGWSDQTFKKSCSNIIKYLLGSRLLVARADAYQISRPMLTSSERRTIRELFGAWGLRMLGLGEAE